MQASLSSEQLQFLHAAVASGRYRNEAEAISEAVWLLQRRDELRAILEVGEKELDAGKGIPAEEFFDWLEKRAADADRNAAGLQQ